MNRLTPIGKNGRAASVGPERFMASVTLRQIRYFIAVAETGKVSTAASMVGISPSVVTEAIQELEILSGTKLFQRQPRGLDLTYATPVPGPLPQHSLGRRRRQSCDVAAGQRDGGTLTLATTITVAGYFLAPLLSRFQNTFPNIEVKVVEGKRLDVEAGLIAGDYDWR